MTNVEKIILDLQSCNTLIRNEAALEAIDHKVQAAVQVLLESTLSPKNIGFNGTLVYALGHFDCSLYFPQLVEIAISHGYEAAQGAMSIIDDQKLTPCQKHLEEALCSIERASSCELTDDQSEALLLIKKRYYKN